MVRGLDINGAKVIAAQAIKGRKGYGVRVFWSEGTLYIATSLDAAMAVPCPDEPRKTGGGYRALIGDGYWTIHLPTCGCKRDPMLAKLTQEQIIALAEGAMIDA